MQNHYYDSDGNPTLIGWFDDFDGDHDYIALSNFFEGDPIYISEFCPYAAFNTGEHAFAAMKARDKDQRARIRNAGSPGEAKALGRACDLREDWEAVKYDVMMAILRAKFTLDRYEGDVLLSTGNALLVEGTYWYDTVWGVALDESPTETLIRQPGRNWLGTMLMARRAELVAEKLYGLEATTGEHNARFANI